MSWVCEDCHREPCECEEMEKWRQYKTERDRLRDLLRRIVIDKDYTAREEARKELGE